MCSANVSARKNVCKWCCFNSFCICSLIDFLLLVWACKSEHSHALPRFRYNENALYYNNKKRNCERDKFGTGWAGLKASLPFQSYNVYASPAAWKIISHCYFHARNGCTFLPKYFSRQLSVLSISCASVEIADSLFLYATAFSPAWYRLYSQILIA